jgi:hypothetical protein
LAARNAGLAQRVWFMQMIHKHNRFKGGFIHNLHALFTATDVTLDAGCMCHNVRS